MCGEHRRRSAEIAERHSRSRVQQPSCDVAYPELRLECFIAQAL